MRSAIYSKKVGNCVFQLSSSSCLFIYAPQAEKKFPSVLFWDLANRQRRQISPKIPPLSRHVNMLSLHPRCVDSAYLFNFFIEVHPSVVYLFCQSCLFCLLWAIGNRCSLCTASLLLIEQKKVDFYSAALYEHMTKSQKYALV